MTAPGSRATSAAFLKLAGFRLEAAADRLIAGEDADAKRLLAEAAEAQRQALTALPDDAEADSAPGCSLRAAAPDSADRGAA
jgi:hypothetical protein